MHAKKIMTAGGIITNSETRTYAGGEGSFLSPKHSLQEESIDITHPKKLSPKQKKRIVGVVKRKK